MISTTALFSFFRSRNQTEKLSQKESERDCERKTEGRKGETEGGRGGRWDLGRDRREPDAARGHEE